MNHVFASPELLIGGAIAGLAFGFLLQKGRLAEFDTIVGQFLLRDFTVLKVMLTAIIVGGFGVYTLHTFGLATLHIKATTLGGNIVGGLIFGAGMAILGYCPGTAVAAAATGARDAIWGIAGMLLGAVLYAASYPAVKASLLPLGDYGKATLASLSGISPGWILLIIAALATGLFLLAESVEARIPVKYSGSGQE